MVKLVILSKNLENNVKFVDDHGKTKGLSTFLRVRVLASLVTRVVRSRRGISQKWLSVTQWFVVDVKILLCRKLLDGGLYSTLLVFSKYYLSQQVLNPRSALLSNFEVLTLLRELESDHLARAKTALRIKEEDQATGNLSRIQPLTDDVPENLRTIEVEVR
jgi:hypothetical protein